MLKKGRSPVSSAMRDLFGRPKNEFFHHRNWSVVSVPKFYKMPDVYLRYHNEVKPKEKSGWMSPMQYRRILGWRHSASKETSAPTTVK